MRGTRTERRQFREELKGSDEAQIRKGLIDGRYGGKNSWKRDMAKEFLRKEKERRRAVQLRTEATRRGIKTGFEQRKLFEMRLGHWIGLALAISAFALFRSCGVN